MHVQPKYALFILSRVDMASMNPGRAIAQASHATCQFEACARGYAPGDYVMDQELFDEGVDEWRKEADSFGTAYVYETDLAGLQEAVVGMDFAYASQITVDPEYFVRDGEVLHRLTDVPTCGWIFGETSKIRRWLRDHDYKMHR